MKNQLAPLVIFTYKRADTLHTLIESLHKDSLAAETILYVFSDGPKSPADLGEINQVRDYIQGITGFKKINYFFAEINKGLATSIISGVTKILETHETAIVLEDDLIVTSNFLTFMNKSLDMYRQEKSVFSISAYSFDLKNYSKNQYDAYFLNRGWSWGWATWKDRWKHVDWEVIDYPQFKNNAKLKRDFNKGGSDLSAMLEKQMNHKLDSWAIRWFYAQFKTQGLTLYPVTSKIINNGFDSRATHTTGDISRYTPQVDVDLNNHFVLPEKIELNEFFQNAFQRKMGITARIKSRLGSIIIALLRKFKLR